MESMIKMLTISYEDLFFSLAHCEDCLDMTSLYHCHSLLEPSTRHYMMCCHFPADTVCTTLHMGEHMIAYDIVQLSFLCQSPYDPCRMCAIPDSSSYLDLTFELDVKNKNNATHSMA
ncbi:hypothetical protein Y1Q_0017932 [Alligator mississippiensis]|uniref:Uncharacterized protein n=1 Tax=Alligator mississippiensis TaxID=8496 RepID=A0A151MXJ4_ALLMI|nr:hypothetical protein Y1Q_0017932 [Alligator mississippiensis]